MRTLGIERDIRIRRRRRVRDRAGDGVVGAFLRAHREAHRIAAFVGRGVRGEVVCRRRTAHARGAVQVVRV